MDINIKKSEIYFIPEIRFIYCTNAIVLIYGRSPQNWFLIVNINYKFVSDVRLCDPIRNSCQKLII